MDQNSKKIIPSVILFANDKNGTIKGFAYC